MFLTQHFFNNQGFEKNHTQFDTMKLMEKANFIALPIKAVVFIPFYR